MEAVLGAADLAKESELREYRVEVQFRRHVGPDELGASELEVLGSHLPELMRELLEIIYENEPGE